jgi:hypothetical protein
MRWRSSANIIAWRTRRSESSGLVVLRKICRAEWTGSGTRKRGSASSSSASSIDRPQTLPWASPVSMAMNRTDGSGTTSKRIESTFGAPRKWSGKATISVYSAGRHSLTRNAPAPMGAAAKASSPTDAW